MLGLSPFFPGSFECPGNQTPLEVSMQTKRARGRLHQVGFMEAADAAEATVVGPLVLWHLPPLKQTACYSNHQYLREFHDPNWVGHSFNGGSTLGSYFPARILRGGSFRGGLWVPEIRLDPVRDKSIWACFVGPLPPQNGRQLQRRGIHLRSLRGGSISVLCKPLFGKPRKILSDRSRIN